MSFRPVALWVGVLAMMLLSGCGDRVNKKALGPDEYFAYAKKKFDNGDYLSASTEFTVVTLRFSGHPVVDEAQYYLAESHFKSEEYLIAISEYEKLINEYPQSPFNQLAQFKVGLSFYRMSLRAELDQEYTRQAMRRFQNFVEENPSHELNEEAQKLIANLREKLAHKQLIGATTYRRMGIWDSALIYYDIVLERYYDTPSAEEAMFFRGESLFKLKRFPEAQTAFTLFLEKFPQSEYASRAKGRLGDLVDAPAGMETGEASLND